VNMINPIGAPIGAPIGGAPVGLFPDAQTPDLEHPEFPSDTFAIQNNEPWPVSQDKFDRSAADLRSTLQKIMSILWDRMTSSDGKGSPPFSEWDFKKVSDMLKTAHESTMALERFQKDTRHTLLSCSIRNNYLHLAAASGRCHIVDGLVKANPFQIDVKNYKGVTALHMAIWHGHHDVVINLIDHGASIHIMAPHGLTPLHLAVNRCDLFLCKLLIATDVESKLVNDKSEKGESALHIAISRQDENIMKLLISVGADVYQRNDKGISCAALAISSENRVISAIMNRYTKLVQTNRVKATLQQTCLKRKRIWSTSAAIIDQIPAEA